MKRLGWIITLPIAVAAVVFSVNNIAPVAVKLWPLPYAIALPLFAIVFAGVLIGFLGGIVVAWLSQAKWRRLARREARDIAALKQDIAIERERAAKAAGRSATGSSGALSAPSAGQPTARYAAEKTDQHAGEDRRV